MEILFEGTVESRKHAWTPSGQIPKEIIEGSGDSLIAKNLLTSNVSPLWMLIQWMLNAHYCQEQDWK